MRMNIDGSKHSALPAISCIRVLQSQISSALWGNLWGKPGEKVPTGHVLIKPNLNGSS